jgi:hypothetical protein
VAMALTLAHALELPGKMRLTKEIYFAMQPIYYPAIIQDSLLEASLSLILTIILLFFTPLGSALPLCGNSALRFLVGDLRRNCT